VFDPKLHKFQRLAGTLVGIVPQHWISAVRGNPHKVSSLKLSEFILNYITSSKLVARVFFSRRLELAISGRLSVGV
jgi:hypothetical protein